MSAFPAKVDLVAYRGDTWAQTFRFLQGGSPVDLISATVASWALSPSGEVVPLVVTFGAPGEVTISQPEGGLTPEQWAYDVEVTNAGVVKTWVRGRLGISADVTNAPEFASVLAA